MPISIEDGDLGNGISSVDDVDDFDMRHLRYFLAVARAGSVSAAAQELHISQPSLSQQIRRLERRVGASLFTRSSRGVQLTSGGRRSCARCSPSPASCGRPSRPPLRARRPGRSGCAAECPRNCSPGSRRPWRWCGPRVTGAPDSSCARSRRPSRPP
ncbi:LysR family transcriptional regulator [Streptacidiphilus sp. 4-A2]|nr:LysR family transcriptional regulator [Streptacidiphilus sp. 4-A2]